MNMNKIKNILILFLVVTAVYQTGRLWLEDTASHNFFYTLFYSMGKGNQNGQENVAVISPQKLIVGYGNKKFSVVYPKSDYDSLIKGSNSTIKDAVENGILTEIEEINWEELLASKVILYDFSFSVAPAEYIKGYQLKNSSIASNIESFDYIAVVPGKTLSENLRVYFINEKTKQAICYSEEKSHSAVSLYSEIDNFQQYLKDDLSYISTKQNSFNLFSDSTFVPQWVQSNLKYKPLLKINPFEVNQEVQSSRLEGYMEGFFSNYAQKVLNKDDNGIYMFSDDTTVVKYYPNGVLEYYNYGLYDSSKEQSLSTAYNAASAFLKKDDSLNTSIFLADVQITSEGLVFYYDYFVNNMQLVLSEQEKDKAGLTHSIEIVVKNNTVKKYKRYAYNFEEKNDEEIFMDIDFITALNSVMMQYEEKEVITQIDTMELGYFVDDSDEIDRKWFIVLNEKLYICDTMK